LRRNKADVTQLAECQSSKLDVATVMLKSLFLDFTDLLKTKKDLIDS